MESASTMNHRGQERQVTLTVISDTNYDKVTPMDFMTIRVGPKSRIVLPAGLRKAAGIDEGSELVGYVDSYGRLVLETAESARNRVWAAAPGPEGDSISEVRAERMLDASQEAAKHEHRATAPTDEGAGDRLLRELGLT